MASVATAQEGRVEDRVFVVEQEIERLDKEIARLDNENDRIITPLTILVGVLAAGGLLGVVFSMRDQRRVSQIHELTVSGETSAQRRAEETYVSFFEASQKTLTLVNDTLGLAKEATDRAQETMHRNAVERLDDIEQKATRLLQPIFGSHEFERVITERSHRVELQELGKALVKIEGYLELQDMELHPHSRFVKGIDQYLSGDIRAAVETLHGAATVQGLDELRRFALYWRGSFQRNLGDYRSAIETFQLFREDLDEDEDERFELDRVIAETRFFELASGGGADRPAERRELVAGPLGELRKLAETYEAHDGDRESRTSHEIAASTGHIYTWIAYDQKRLYWELGAEERRDAPDAGDERIRREALRDALKIYEARKLVLKGDEEGADFDIEFGKAECEFAFGDVANLERDLTDVERLAADRPGAHREERKAVEFAQTRLITACRRLRLAELAAKKPTKKNVEQQQAGAKLDLSHWYGRVADAYHQTTGALDHLSDHDIRLFSQIQRRNLTQDEFFAEVKALHDQAIDHDRWEQDAGSASADEG